MPSTALVRHRQKQLVADSRAAQGRARSRAEELLAHIARNMSMVTEAFFEIGAALSELANNRMHVALGYASFEQMLAERNLMSDVQARKLIAVATHVPREAAVRLGPERSYMLTRVAHASGEPSVAALVRRGHLDGRPIEDMTVRELGELARRKRDAVRPSTRPEDSVARRAQAALRKAGMGRAKLRAVRRDGEAVFVLELDESALERLMRRL